MIGITSTQPMGFLFCSVLGLLAGMIYALLTPFRRRRKGKTTVFLIDLLFWIFAAGLFLLGLYAATGGIFRVFCLAAFLLGFLIALTGPGYYIMNLERRLLRRLDAYKQRARMNRMDDPE